jgi:cellulose synthase/poly-beta-1,6-N-acetylglucosamine synthase-like glycosyltransferase/peptidoglycan/xylan/chitin deacetylase (PgdA/CDA1 family)
MANKPIFFDASGRRAARIKVVAWVVGAGLAVILAGFGASLVLSPPVTGLNLPGRASIPNPANLVRRAQKPGLLPRAERLAALARKRRLLEIARRRRGQSALPGRVLPAILKPQPGRPLAIGFYTNWAGKDDPSWPSLKRSLKYLDWFVPVWITLDGPELRFRTWVEQRSLNYVRANKPGTAILPIIQNVTGGKWDSTGLAKLLADRARSDALLARIVRFVAKGKFQGITIDFEEEGWRPADHKNLEDFLTRMSAAFAPHDWIIAQAVPFDDAGWPYRAYANIVDYTILMAYDETDGEGAPGPIAAQAWYEKILDRRMRQLSADSTIVAIGSYAYDWVKGGTTMVNSFEGAMTSARDNGATVQFDSASNNPHFSYNDNDGTHDVWFLDGVTAFNQIHAADPYRPAGYALWKLGYEDPSILPLMDRRYNSPAPASLEHIANNLEDVDFDGRGEILRVMGDPSLGRRSLTVEKTTGDIVDERYDSLPTSYIIRRVGGSNPKRLALTFDDGPDPEWTPTILDILKEKKVPATFFMIGANMEAHPGLVQRVMAEGHEAGNHTYTHPNLADTPPTAVRLELNATQRLFQALTGRSLRLFRSPYLTDASPSDADEIEPIKQAQSLGYIEVTANLDSLDWQNRTVAQMKAQVFRALTNPNPDLRGNVILMHDSGGDRSKTLLLLPQLIDALRAKGYSFVPLSDLAGFSRDAVMPRLPLTVSLYADRVVFLTFSYLGQFLYYCFLGAIVLGVARLLVLAGLALWKRVRGEGRPLAGDGAAAVTVLIPAFNEEKVIAATVERILASDYPGLDVLVIDDGSKDQTAAIVRAHFAADSRVDILSIANGGKANALNVGLANAKGAVIVALDADTQFEPATISRLVRWFTDPEIGAVAGNAKVGNRINMITRWQALEYIVAQNLERRALSALDTLTVVPGAVGAWRRDVLQALGGFPPDTLAEDQDLTIAVQTRGYRVHFDSSAVAWTEAPATARGLAKQRFRWAYGTLQCLWKYRGITFNGNYGELGLVALPQVWLFQILLTTLAPVADLLLVWQLVSEYLTYLQGPNQYTGSNLRIIAVYYAVFIVVDLLAAMIGFLMEKGEDWNLLWWLPLQRFGYRQIMYYVVVRSLWTALRGPFVGWGKLERTGTVRARA